MMSAASLFDHAHDEIRERALQSRGHGAYRAAELRNVVKPVNEFDVKVP